MARRRNTYGGRSDAGHEAARRHIREAKVFSQELGGTDQDVKTYFFGLRGAQLEQILVAYGNQYGPATESYARSALSNWRSGRTQMSGLVAKRLFDLLPPRMPVEKKHELASSIWRHFGPQSKIYLSVGPDADVGELAEWIGKKLEAGVTAYSIPDNVKRRFAWLTSGDIEAMQELLNHFRTLDKNLAIAKVLAEVPVFQRQVKANSDISKSVKSVLKVHKHEFHITIDHRLGDQSKELRPPTTILQTNESSGFGWVWWVVGGLFVLWLIS